MAVYKEEKTNTWRAVYRYTDWNGERKQTQKRGFKTKREAQAWEREQLNKTSADLDMTFRSFVDLYTADMKTRLKENTWASGTIGCRASRHPMPETEPRVQGAKSVRRTRSHRMKFCVQKGLGGAALNKQTAGNVSVY